MANEKSTDPEVSFRDKIATVDKRGKRIWLFPQQPKGQLYNARKILSYVFLAVFFALPFVKIDGHPLFLINVLQRKFIIFGQIFWPQEFFIFAVGMVTSIVFIALFTVIFGRIFCGWICPQTIFMEMVFRRIEYLFEGDAAQMKLLDKAPWDTNKILRRGGKWITSWMVSFIICNTFLAYVVGADELLGMISDPGANIGSLFSLIVFTTVFYFVYAFMREQVCLIICPYGRMQGVLLDRDSIVVAYDYKRGEQRGKFHKNETRTLGDCIDCAQCVKVCPTGIDIRNGTQLECVNCTACIDACNKMMTSVGLPTGLIRYDSENAIANKQPHKITVKMKAYTVVMALLLSLLVGLLVTRTDVGMLLIRTPGQTYQEQPNHQYSNVYNYKLQNKTFNDREVELRPENFKGTIKIIGNSRLTIPKDGVAFGSMLIYLDSADVKNRKTEIKLAMYEGNKKLAVIKTNFLGPFNMN
jgi:cytochrome c oxidase accessory protein FixG